MDKGKTVWYNTVCTYTEWFIFDLQLAACKNTKINDQILSFSPVHKQYQSFQLSRNGRDSPGILVCQSVPPGTITCLFNVPARRRRGRHLEKLEAMQYVPASPKVAYQNLYNDITAYSYFTLTHLHLSYWLW